MSRFRMISLITASVAFSLVASACSAGKSPTPTTTTAPTTTIPVTTTTVTSIGGFVSTQWCPQYEVTGDGSEQISDGGTEIYYGVIASPSQIFTACSKNLRAQSWTVDDTASHLSNDGGVIQAHQGSAWALVTITQSSLPTVKVCTWPSKPSSLLCP